jgi:hypothetical protein
MGLANGFLALHVVISLVAVYGAWRLRAALRARRVEERREAAAAAATRRAPEPTPVVVTACRVADLRPQGGWSATGVSR